MSEIVEAILKLKIQDDQVFGDIDKLAAKLGVLSVERRKAEDELNALINKEQQLTAARDKASSPNAQAKYNAEIKKTQDAIAAMTIKIQEATAAEQKMTTQTEKLDSTLDKAFEVAGINGTKDEIQKLGKEVDKAGKEAKDTKKDFEDLGKKKVKIQLGDDVHKFVNDLSASGIAVKAQIKQMENALLQLDETDPRFLPLKASLTEMKDRFKDFREDLEANTGEPLERIGGNFRTLAGSILTLDFGQANKALAGLASGIRALKFSEAIGGIKSLGKNIFDVGKALLTNPLFLLAALIVIIIINFDKLKKSTGLLGDIFKAVGAIIGFFVDLLKDLGDAIGITSFAFDAQTEAIRDNVAAYDKMIEKQREAAEQQEKLFESNERLRISLIKDTKQRNDELAKLDEDLYLNRVNNRAKDTENLKAQLAEQEKNIKRLVNPEVDEFLKGINKSLSSITFLSGQNMTPTVDFDSPLLKGFKLSEEAQKEKDKLDDIQKQINANTVQNNLDANAIFTKANEEENKRREEQQKKWEQYLKDRNKLFDDENRKLLTAQRNFRQAIIDTQFLGFNKIQANFDLQRKAVLDQAEADKKAAAATLNKTDATIYNAKVTARLTVDLMTLSIRQRDEEIKNAKAVSDAKIEFAKKSSETEIELLLLAGAIEDDVYAQRFQATEDYYEAKIKASDDFFDAEISAATKELLRLQASGTATKEEIAQQNQALLDLVEAKIQANIALTQDEELALAGLRAARLKRQFDANKAELDEETRHQLAMLDIEGATESELLDAEIASEKKKLNLLIDSHQATAAELEAQNNKVLELEAKKNALVEKMQSEHMRAMIDGIALVTNATISATERIIQAQISMYDRLIQAQQNRVDQARDIAEQGNAELLEEEQKRLDELQKKREKFVRAQQALAVVELIINTAVAVSKAAAEGGAAAPFTIAATLIALIAGLAQARSLASQAAFFKGGLYDGEGYTGSGNIHEESKRLGNKPYTYHKEEFIFNNEKTRKYRDIFERVHKGKIDLRAMESKAIAFERMKALPMMNTATGLIMPTFAGQAMDIAELREDVKDLTKAVRSQDRLRLSINEKGIHGIVSRYEDDIKRAKNLAK